MEDNTMSLTARQTADLKVMALEGAKNANICMKPSAPTEYFIGIQA